MTGAILSGGENTRIPVLKGLLKVEGREIIARSLDVLRKIFDRVVINTDMPEVHFRFGAPLIGDIKKEKGPMTGILSVLAATGAEAVFVVACDMPFISERLIGYMVDSFEGQGSMVKGQVDAVIPVFNGKYEPLFGIYTKKVIRPMEDAINNGKKGINEMLRALNVLYISERDVRSIDYDGSSFVNINTMEDYERIGGKLCSV